MRQVISSIVYFLFDNESVELPVQSKHNMTHTGEKPIQGSVRVMIINNQNSIHTCENRIQMKVYVVTICCLVGINTSEKLTIRQVLEIKIRINIGIHNYHFMLINKSFLCSLCGYANFAENIEYDISLHSYQANITHECFTSHSKVYLLVCYGSGNIVRIYLILNTTVLSSIHCNRYQSNRMSLLRLVNFIPAGWSVIVYKYMVPVYVRYHALSLRITVIYVYWGLILIHMPFSCTLCDFEISTIYHKCSVSSEHHAVGIIICNCMLSTKSSKNDTTILYFCNG